MGVNHSKNSPRISLNIGAYEMTSKITFSNIKHIVVKSFSDISKTERKEGKLQAGEITSRLSNGQIIDVMALKALPVLTTDTAITFNENDILPNTRRTFSELNDLFRRKGRLPVHADFFRRIENGDTIVIILHDVNTQTFI